MSKMRSRALPILVLCLAALALPGIAGAPAAGSSPPFTLVNERNEFIREVKVASVLRTCAPPLGRAAVRTDPYALLFVARDTLRYLDTQQGEDPLAVRAGMAGRLGYTLEDTKRTLRFLQAVLEEDLRSQSGRSRLQDSRFLEESFRFVQFTGDAAAARRDRVQISREAVRITKYAVFRVKGSPVRTDTCGCALYAVPDDEQGLSVKEAESRRESLARFRYTKQQVLAGAFEGDCSVKARPLVWLTRDGLEEALMEGTIYVDMPSGVRRVFNVDRNNGIAYVRSVKNPRLQRRYWYFREVSGIKGYGHTMETKITLMPKVAFAGDVVNFGLGKLVAVKFRNPQSRRAETLLGVLADTGGAFTGNMYQLDFLAGVFPSKDDYHSYVRSLPGSGQAYFLFRR